MQSHTVHGPGTEALRASRGAAEPYDGIAEVWFEAGLLEGLTPEAVAAGLELAEDEAQFIDLARSSLFLTRETEVFGPDQESRKSG